jgi:quercetin dioxygenase-like cupin family protein
MAEDRSVSETNSFATVFKFDDLAATPAPDIPFERRVVGAEHMMILEARIPAGLGLPSHSHPNEQISYVIAGRARFWSGSPPRESIVGPGTVVVIPPNVPHGAEALEDLVQMDVICPPRPELLEVVPGRPAL